jgi:hypothetical protein
VIEPGTECNGALHRNLFRAGMMRSINGNFVIAKPVCCSRITVNKEGIGFAKISGKTLGD